MSKLFYYIYNLKINNKFMLKQILRIYTNFLMDIIKIFIII